MARWIAPPPSVSRSYLFVACTVMAHIATASVVRAYAAMAYRAVDYIVMAHVI